MKLLQMNHVKKSFNDETLHVLKDIADIQVEEQNHAEMLFKYKTVNGMA